jgi:hypothetical protein
MSTAAKTPSARLPRFAAISGLLVLGLSLVACPGPDARYREGSGGNGATSSSASSTTASAGGGGGAGGQATGGGGAGGEAECADVGDCPLATECVSYECSAGACVPTFSADGTALATQSDGDCQVVVCDGAGHEESRADDGDPFVDDNECTLDECLGGAPSNPNTAAGEACVSGGSYCDGSGSCVECLVPAQCASSVCSGGACQSATCNDGVQNGSETGLDCGGPSCLPCPVLLAVAGSSSAMWAGELGASGVWSGGAVAATMASAPSLAIDGLGSGVAVFRAPTTNLLTALIHPPGGAWSAPAIVDPLVTTREAPSAVGGDTGVHVVFHGSDFKHYYAQFAAGAWAVKGEKVQLPGMGLHSFGPSPARVAVLGQDVVIAHAGNDSNVYVQVRTAGVWQVATQLAANTSLPPAIVALPVGPELLVAFADSTGLLRFATRTQGAWTAPAAVPSALTNDPPSLAALPNGDVWLGFRGQNGKLYVAKYSAGSFGAASDALTPAPAITSAPTLAPGLSPVMTELLYVDGASALAHTRLDGLGVWSAASAPGAVGVTYAAAASFP